MVCIDLRKPDQDNETVIDRQRWNGKACGIGERR